MLTFGILSLLFLLSLIFNFRQWQRNQELKIKMAKIAPGKKRRYCPAAQADITDPSWYGIQIQYHSDEEFQQKYDRITSKNQPSLAH